MRQPRPPQHLRCCRAINLTAWRRPDGPLPRGRAVEVLVRFGYATQPQVVNKGHSFRLFRKAEGDQLAGAVGVEGTQVPGVGLHANAFPTEARLREVQSNRTARGSEGPRAAHTCRSDDASRTAAAVAEAASTLPHNKTNKRIASSAILLTPPPDLTHGHTHGGRSPSGGPKHTSKT